MSSLKCPWHRCVGVSVAALASALMAAPAQAANFCVGSRSQAQAALGISARELAVLHEIAAGHSNKEIAARLHVSPNTVKTHVARLLEKLGAKRRTDALRRARELGLMP